MKHSITFFLLFISAFLFSRDYLQGTIYLKNGKEINGYIEPPHKCWYNSVSYKESENGESKEVESTDITHIIVKAKNNKVYKFVFAKIRTYRVKTFEFKTTNREQWMVRIDGENEDNAEYYINTNRFVITKKGELRLEGLPQVPYMVHFIKKRNEDFVNSIGETGMGGNYAVNRDKDTKKLLSYFFQDDPVLVEKITTDKISYIGDICAAYSQP